MRGMEGAERRRVDRLILPLFKTGWKGGGLGKHQDGITDYVKVRVCPGDDRPTGLDVIDVMCVVGPPETHTP